jgi:threonine synthase
MAASVSAYAAQAGLPCFVLVPEGTPVGKLAQTLAYGARVIQIRGTYDTCILLARASAKEHNFFLCGDYAFRREGQKSIAYEIVEQLNWQAPEMVICPIGYGTNLAGIYKGFVEFKKLGLIDRIPIFVGVQAAGCSPIADAILRGEMSYIPVEKPNTIASAVAACDPCDAPFIFKALSETAGYALKYSDQKMLEAQKMLGGTEGLFVEPSSALPLAALIESSSPNASNWLKQNHSLKNLRIVLIATGNGLKDPNSILSAIEQPPLVDGELSVVNELLKQMI